MRVTLEKMELKKKERKNGTDYVYSNIQYIKIAYDIKYRLSKGKEILGTMNNKNVNNENLTAIE